METPHFSIIVPVYNTSIYLEKCVESLLGQDDKNYEIILIDDASTDDSKKMMQEMQEKYANVIKCLYNKKNSGLSATRNNGIKEAKGEYLIFIDSDDYMERNVLGRIYKTLQKNNFPDILYAGFYEELPQETTKQFKYVSGKNQLYDSRIFLKNELSERKLYAPACCGVCRRELVVENKLRFGEGLLHEDELWTPTILYHAKTIYVSDIYLFHYVKRENSITTAKDKTKNGLDLLKISEMVRIRYSDENDNKLKKLMNNHVAMLYMKGVQTGKLYRKHLRKNVNRFYPIKYASTLYDKMKALLLIINLKWYCVLNEKQMAKAKNK